MKDLIGKLVRRKERSSSSTSSTSSSRYSRLCKDNSNGRHETRRGYVPVLVGNCEEEEERFMVPLGWMNHPCIVALLQLAANEFEFHQQGVIQIPCEPHHFRVVMENIVSCN